MLWDDGYEPATPRTRVVRRLALGGAAVIVLAGATCSGLRLVGRGAAPARDLVAPPSEPTQAASVAAVPVESPLPSPTPPPRDTAPLLVERPAPRASPPARPRASVVAAPGRLFVGATPWGELYIDGRPVGHTPVVALPIAAGWHQVRVVRDGFAAFEQRIRIAPGEDLRLTGIVLRPFHL